MTEQPHRITQHNRYTDKENDVTIYQYDYQWPQLAHESNETNQRLYQMKKTNFILGKDNLKDNLVSSKQLDYSKKEIPQTNSKDFIDKIKNTNIKFDCFQNDFKTTNQQTFQQKNFQKTLPFKPTANNVKIGPNKNQQTVDFNTIYQKSFQSYSINHDNIESKDVIQQRLKELRDSHINFNLEYPKPCSTFQNDYQPKQFTNQSAEEALLKKQKLQKTSIKLGGAKFPDQFLSSQQSDFKFKPLQDDHQELLQEIKSKNTVNNIEFGTHDNNYITEAQANFTNKFDDILENHVPKNQTNHQKTHFKFGKDEPNQTTDYQKQFQQPDPQQILENQVKIDKDSLSKTNWNFGSHEPSYITENQRNFQQFDQSTENKNHQVSAIRPKDQISLGDFQQNWVTENQHTYQPIDKDIYKGFKIVNKQEIENQQRQIHEKFNHYTEYQMKFQEKPYSKENASDMSKYNRFNILKSVGEQMNTTYRQEFNLRIIQ